MPIRKVKMEERRKHHHFLSFRHSSSPRTNKMMMNNFFYSKLNKVETNVALRRYSPVHKRFIEVDLIFQQVNRFQYKRNKPNLNILLFYFKSTTQRLTSSKKVNPKFHQVDLLATMNWAIGYTLLFIYSIQLSYLTIVEK